MASEAQDELVAILHAAREKYLRAVHQALLAGVDVSEVHASNTVSPRKERTRRQKAGSEGSSEPAPQRYAEAR